MVQEQLVERGITDPAVLHAMSVVPRHCFVQEALRAQAYEDTPLPIGYGQTISQPYIVARMSQLLEVRQGMRVLEIGTGSGYQAAVLAVMGCTVFTVERIRELYQSASVILRELGIRAIHMQRRDGTLGMPEAAPFDRILVTAGGPSVPRPLVEQLEMGGILLMPIGDKPRSLLPARSMTRQQRLVRVRKTGKTLMEEDFGAVDFVDLVGDHGWHSRTARP